MEELADDGAEANNAREEAVETAEEDVDLRPLKLLPRRSQSHVDSVFFLLQRRLLRRDWHGVRDLVATMLQYACPGPIDIFKGAFECLRNQNADSTSRIRFLRKFCDKLHPRVLVVQRVLTSELLSLELAYYLCLQGRIEEALVHLRSVVLEVSFSTNPLFQVYLGLLALQLALEKHHKVDRDTMQDESDTEKLSLVAEAIKSLETAHAQLPESDCVLFYRLKALLYFSPSKENIKSAKSIVNAFVESFPDHPIGHRIRIEFLQCFRPADYKALRSAVKSLLRIDPMSDLAFSILSQQLYREGRISEEDCFCICLERLCYMRNDTAAWKLLADVLRNAPWDDQPPEHILPEKWWTDIHFRHPRQLSRELGLAADSNVVHANRPKGKASKTKSFASATLDSLRFLMDKCSCAVYLLPTEHRFIEDTLVSLELSGFVDFAREIAETCKLMKAKHQGPE